MKNKKVLIIAIVAVVLVVAVVLGVVLLGGKKDDGDTTTTTTTNPPAPPAPVEVSYKLGMGVVFGELKNGEINATLATVVLDNDGKIVSCRLDAVQNKFTVDFDEETVDFTKLDTKMELGSAYGMSTSQWSSDNDGDGRVLEWDVQAKAFEAYVVGKTGAEVAAMTTQLVNDHHISTDDALLSAGCTIQIGDFRDAVVKACNDDQAVPFVLNEGTTFTLGLAANSADDGSEASEDGATIKMNTDISASVVVNGKIVASLNDAIQPQVKLDGEGEVTEVSVGKGADVLKTKRELKEAYGMAGNQWSSDNDGDGRILEWYKQSAAFSAHVVGMTGAEVAAMTTVEADGHHISADADLIAAGCTIQISGIQAVVAESVANAR